MRLITDRVDTVREKKISKLKGIVIEIIPNETQEKNTLKVNSVPMPCNTISSFLTGMSLEYQKWSRVGKTIFGDTMATFFSKLDNNFKPTDPKMQINFKMNNHK